MTETATKATPTGDTPVDSAVERAMINHNKRTAIVTPIQAIQIQGEYHEIRDASGRIIVLTDILPEHAAEFVKCVNSFEALVELAGNVATMKIYGDVRNEQIRADAKELIATLAGEE